MQGDENTFRLGETNINQAVKTLSSVIKNSSFTIPDKLNASDSAYLTNLSSTLNEINCEYQELIEWFEDWLDDLKRMNEDASSRIEELSEAKDLTEDEKQKLHDIFVQQDIDKKQIEAYTSNLANYSEQIKANNTKIKELRNLLNRYENNYAISDDVDIEKTKKQIQELESKTQSIQEASNLIKTFQQQAIEDMYALYMSCPDWATNSSLRIASYKLNTSGSNYNIRAFQAYQEDTVCATFYDKKGREISVSDMEAALYFYLNNKSVPTYDNNTKVKEYYNDYIPYLSDNEIKAISYIGNVKGTAAVDEYVGYKQEIVNNRNGYLQASELTDKVDYMIASGRSDFEIYTELFGNGLSDGLVQFFSGMNNILGADGKVSAAEYKSMYIMQYINDTYGTEKLKNVVATGSYEIGSSVGNMLPSIAASAIVSLVLSPAGGALTAETIKAAKIAQTAGRIVGTSFMGLSAAGNAEEQGLQQGMSQNQALIYGILNGLSETTLEYFIGGIPGLSRLENAKGFIGFLGRLAGEGLEESSQEVLDSVMQATITGNQTQINWGQVLKSGIYGVLTAGLMNGGSLVIGGVEYQFKSTETKELNILTQKYAKKNLNDPQIQEELTNDLVKSNQKISALQESLSSTSSPDSKIQVENDKVLKSTEEINDTIQESAVLEEINTLEDNVRIEKFQQSIKDLKECFNPNSTNFGNMQLFQDLAEKLFKFSGMEKKYNDNTKRAYENFKTKYLAFQTYCEHTKNHVMGVAKLTSNIINSLTSFLQSMYSSSTSMVKYSENLIGNQRQTLEQRIKLWSSESLKQHFSSKCDYENTFYLYLAGLLHDTGMSDDETFVNIFNIDTKNEQFLLDVIELKNKQHKIEYTKSSDGTMVSEKYTGEELQQQYNELQLKEELNPDEIVKFGLLEGALKEYGDTIRENHSAISALNSLIFLKDSGIPLKDQAYIALTIFAHSKSNSGVGRLTNAADWSICINKLKKMIELYNGRISDDSKKINLDLSDFVEYEEALNSSGEKISRPKIIYDKTSFKKFKHLGNFKYDYETYSFKDGIIEKLATSGLAIRLGDACVDKTYVPGDYNWVGADGKNYHSSKALMTQSGVLVAYDTSTCRIDENTVIKELTDKKSLDDLSKAEFLNTNNIAMFDKDGSIIEDVSANPFGAMFVIGEGNVSFDPRFDINEMAFERLCDYRGALVLGCRVHDGTVVPRSTQNKGINERIGEILGANIKMKDGEKEDATSTIPHIVDIKIEGRYNNTDGSPNKQLISKIFQSYQDFANKQSDRTNGQIVRVSFENYTYDTTSTVLTGGEGSEMITIDMNTIKNK